MNKTAITYLYKKLPVIIAYTVVNIRAVMIEHFNTSITYPTMFGADRFNGSTGMADSL